jgi:fructokinase
MRIGIDLGGTKIEAIALADDGRELARRRVETPRRDYDGTVATIAGLVAELERAAGGPASVGVGIPGTISPATGLVKNANSTWLIGRPFDRDLAHALKRPVRLANDANCFALSEATDGAGAGAAVVFGVILGTGVGGGLVVHGRVVEGANWIAGEWGHNPMPWPNEGEWPGPPCYCGRSGCIETLLSGPGLEREFAERVGVALPAEAIAAGAASGEPEPNAALGRYLNRLARALASVINVVDPDVIVLGGGLSNIDVLYTAVPEQWGLYVFSDRVVTRLLRARHGDTSGVRGAAWLWNA